MGAAHDIPFGRSVSSFFTGHAFSWTPSRHGHPGTHLSVADRLTTPLQSRWYILDPEFLHQLAQSSIATHGNNTEKIIDSIVTNLTETYGSRYINPRQDEWVFNNAGGAMGTARGKLSPTRLTLLLTSSSIVIRVQGLCT